MAVDERILAMAARLFPRIGKRDGVPESELKPAEKRLGFTLPGALREMYRLSGRRIDLHAAHDRLHLPSKLIVVNKALVFYEQSERTAAWAIPMAHIAEQDPPVVRAANEPPYTWEPDHDSVSAFFFTQLLWQHVNSSPCATVPVTPEVLTRASGVFEPIALVGCRWEVGGCWGSGGVVLFARGDTLHIGATSEQELTGAMEKLTPDRRPVS